jgi:voltage-gated potassium channel
MILFGITLMYGLVYSILHRLNPKAFEFKGIIDPFYFSFTTMSTVGYGDYSPKTNMAKLLVMSQQAILIGEIVSIIAERAEMGAAAATIAANIKPEL